MEYLTFGEQVKIILGRKGMTIKQLAEMIEEKTGKKMSRQNLTQRLGRDNFQEQDMRMIASILGCPFHLSIMSAEEEGAAEESQYAAVTEPKMKELKTADEQEVYVQQELPLWGETQSEDNTQSEDKTQSEDNTQPEDNMQPEYETQYQGNEQQQMPHEEKKVFPEESDERDMTIGELYEIHEELSELEENVKAGESVEAIKEELEKPKKERFAFFRRRHTDRVPQTVQLKEEKEEEKLQQEEPETITEETVVAEERQEFEPVITHNDADEDKTVGEVNPYTGREYQSNSVRMHPTRIGYVQVYDRSIHKWTDMTEWAFLGYQERKKALLGKAYEPPIYLD